jgi:hypothetical protein
MLPYGVVDIKEGKIVPVDITVKLILNAMEKSKVKKFLIDGFPRAVDNYEVRPTHEITFVSIFHLLSAILIIWC